eukprot:CAMPEP_0175325526 /NCGR_PEP_ID=MMETSP0093-20121207/74056_1 /TAXON_ID=311494 /ORGANISM="Alexandrium monilatum, Strain CCMP3105" /LENGTH=80 /DNA_ID=CAMNT_0016622489 /DNA_START=53 /DNA_END=292 /DNA_ORIENTATION=+
MAAGAVVQEQVRGARRQQHGPRCEIDEVEGNEEERKAVGTGKETQKQLKGKHGINCDVDSRHWCAIPVHGQDFIHECERD